MGGDRLPRRRRRINANLGFTLRQIADEEDRTVSNLLTRIVKEWLAARGAKTRKAS